MGGRMDRVLARQGDAQISAEVVSGAAFWTPERIAILETYVAAGMPYLEIGQLLGCGKNAAIGKARRMGLSERHPRATLTDVPSGIFPRLDAINVFPPKGRCVFPIGHPKQDLRFCGSSVDHGSYCTEHRAIAYTKTAPELMAAE